MNPDDNQITPGNTPSAPQQSPNTIPANQAAAANVVRTQIENIYNHSSDQPTHAEPAQQSNPYERTHQDNPQPILEQWKQYHSAWQTYYQRYYEGYYTHHLENAKQTIKSQIGAVPVVQQAVFTHQAEPEQQVGTTQDEALYDLRKKLLLRVSESAKKVRKSRHFVPITAAISVVILFAFLQYNQFLIGTVMAYVSPGAINPQNIIIDPTSNVSVPPDPRLIIPKINVVVPVLYDVGNDYNSQMAAMTKGVAQFAIPGANSHPGQIGNTVIAGHSSNDLIEGGDYKFIFVQLDKLEVGDSIYINYNSVRYSYTVTKKEVVKPTEVSKLVYPTTLPVLTLLTCTPVGTALNRLLVTAQQVSPDPSASTAAPTASTNQVTAVIPGSSPTLLERLFGGR